MPSGFARSRSAGSLPHLVYRHRSLIRQQLGNTEMHLQENKAVNLALEVTERHHHDGLDLFPDFGWVVPFGTGTSVVYNYLDYRVRNSTDRTYQLRVWVDSTHLCGELWADAPEPYSYHIATENEYFSREGDGVCRNGEVYRRQIDRRTGNTVVFTQIQKNHARCATIPRC